MIKSEFPAPHDPGFSRYQSEDFTSVVFYSSTETCYYFNFLKPQRSENTERKKEEATEIKEGQKSRREQG